MGFDWKLYIRLSDELITHQRDRKLKKAYLRTALSRYYYGWIFKFNFIDIS